MRATIAFVVIFLAFYVDCASHKHHKAKHHEEGHEEEDWPRPEEIKNFDVAPEMTEGLPENTENPSGVPTTPAPASRKGRKH